ncbi:MAG: hypothetical protein AAB536_01655 [Patescibacteria group bacterium]
MSTQIPSKQLFTRWDALPDSLKEAIASETNSNVVWKAAEDEHLPKEKIVMVSRLAGYVLMGFIHPEDLTGEIKDSLGIDARIASSVANSINTKIFQPLRDELEKIYAPALSEVEASAAEEKERGGYQKPVMVEEIAKPMPRPEKPIPAPIAPSKIPAVPRPSAPFMLHRESESQPGMRPQPNFKVIMPGEQFGKMDQKWTAPPKPAQIETGFVPKAAPRIPEKDSLVVHYSEMRTPLAPAEKNRVVSAVPPALSGVEAPAPQSTIQNAGIKPITPQPPKPATTTKNVVPENLQRPELPAGDKK